jgi:hypothetical protein
MDTLTLEEILQAEAVSAIPKTMYVWHDDTGTITGISNSPNDGGYLEVPKSRLKDFLSGKKDYCRYNIDYFKFDNALTTKDEIVKVSSTLVYEIPRVTDKGVADFTIIHNKKQKRWQILLSDSAKDMISKINPSTTFDFYLTKIKDPHYLFKTITIKVSDIKNGNKLHFKSDFEEDVDAFSISTFGYFKSYGLLVV